MWRRWDLRKPHDRLPRFLLRLVLVGLGCCLMPQFGPGQLPNVERRGRVTLGPPTEPEKMIPQVIDFEPIKKPIPNKIVLPPTTPPIVVFEPTYVILPRISTLPVLAVPTTPPFSPEPPLLEDEIPPDPMLPALASPDAQPKQDLFERPTFGAVVAISDPPTTVPGEGTPGLNHGTNDPEKITPSELAVARFETPAPGPLPEDSSLELGIVSRQPFLPVESQAMTLAQMQHQARERAYMTRLGSRNGTPHFMGTYPRNDTAYSPVPMYRSVAPQRRIHGVLHWAFASAFNVRVRLAEPFHYFD